MPPATVSVYGSPLHDEDAARIMPAAKITKSGGLSTLLSLDLFGK
jgi:hypothetical protein